MTQEISINLASLDEEGSDSTILVTDVDMVLFGILGEYGETKVCFAEFIEYFSLVPIYGTDESEIFLCTDKKLS